MRTDSRRLFEAGIALAVETWQEAAQEFDWSDTDYFVAHQTSVKHIGAMAKMLNVDRSRFPMTLPQFGNMGPAAVPFTLATQVDTLQAGDKVLLLGIGSGLNTSFAEITW
jgi:3-oxoacyl-[acyl-carrier-protein] synthase-3